MKNTMDEKKKTRASKIARGEILESSITISTATWRALPNGSKVRATPRSSIEVVRDEELRLGKVEEKSEEKEKEEKAVDTRRYEEKEGKEKQEEEVELREEYERPHEVGIPWFPSSTFLKHMHRPFDRKASIGKRTGQKRVARTLSISTNSFLRVWIWLAASAVFLSYSSLSVSAAGAGFAERESGAGRSEEQPVKSRRFKKFVEDAMARHADTFEMAVVRPMILKYYHEQDIFSLQGDSVMCKRGAKFSEMLALGATTAELGCEVLIESGTAYGCSTEMLARFFRAIQEARFFRAVREDINENLLVSSVDKRAHGHPISIISIDSDLRYRQFDRTQDRIHRELGLTHVHFVKGDIYATLPKVLESLKPHSQGSRNHTGLPARKLYEDSLPFPPRLRDGGCAVLWIDGPKRHQAFHLGRWALGKAPLISMVAVHDVSPRSEEEMLFDTWENAHFRRRALWKSQDNVHFTEKKYFEWKIREGGMVIMMANRTDMFE